MRILLPVMVLMSAAYAQTLMNVEWLEKSRADPKLIILDARPEADYAKGHIPGAISINAYDNMVESTPEGEKVLHQWLTDTFGRLGIAPDDKVIVYEEKVGMRAARAFWMLSYTGLTAVCMLEGGLEAWKARGLPLTTEATRSPRSPSRFKLRPQKKYVASAPEVAALGKERKTLILDVRTREEFEGKSGSECCPRHGRIPGAVWIEWTEFLSADRTSFQAPEKLGIMLLEKGITPDRQIVTYCHRGARSAVVWAALDSLGYPKVKNYIASWHEWANRKELPAE